MFFKQEIYGDMIPLNFEFKSNYIKTQPVFLRTFSRKNTVDFYNSGQADTGSFQSGLPDGCGFEYVILGLQIRDHCHTMVIFNLKTTKSLS